MLIDSNASVSDFPPHIINYTHVMKPNEMRKVHTVACLKAEQVTVDAVSNHVKP